MRQIVRDLDTGEWANGGEGGSRTFGTLMRTMVFETALVRVYGQRDARSEQIVVVRVKRMSLTKKSIKVF